MDMVGEIVVSGLAAALRGAEDASGAGRRTAPERRSGGPEPHVAAHQIQREICARWTQNASVLGRRVLCGLLDSLHKLSPLSV